MRPLALLCAAGLAAALLAGCGGKVEGCLAPGPCEGDFPHEPATPAVSPATATLQVGGSTTLTALAPGISGASYQWYRTAGGASGTAIPGAIPGATQPSYTLPAAQIADDGSAFSVTVSGSFEGRAVTLQSSASRLAVSRLPGVVFEDRSFAAADWATAVVSEPAANGPTLDVSQPAAGGNPGSWRRLDIALPAGASRLLVFQAYQAALYDPALQGPVYLVEIAQDCIALPGVLGSGPTLLIEQGGRRFIAGGTPGCTASWAAQSLVPSRFGVADFLQVDGPACAAGQACPDFSALGAPIRLGFANSNQGTAGFAGAAGGFGIDNWRVTVWRR